MDRTHMGAEFRLVVFIRNHNAARLIPRFFSILNNFVIDSLLFPDSHCTLIERILIVETEKLNFPPNQLIINRDLVDAEIFDDGFSLLIMKVNDCKQFLIF